MDNLTIFLLRRRMEYIKRESPKIQEEMMNEIKLALCDHTQANEVLNEATRKWCKQHQIMFSNVNLVISGYSLEQRFYLHFPHGLKLFVVTASIGTFNVKIDNQKETTDIDGYKNLLIEIESILKKGKLTMHV